MKLNLDSIILFVHDVDKLKSFYTEFFKLEIMEASHGWILLKAGDCKIGLHKIGEQYGGETERTGKPGSNCKIVFQIDEDIHKFREQLLQQRVSVKEIKTFDNYDYWLCDGEDPEGNVFQLKQKK
ncbi:MAG: VOC family protein [Ferruginibacter sp.]